MLSNSSSPSGWERFREAQRRLFGWDQSGVFLVRFIMRTLGIELSPEQFGDVAECAKLWQAVGLRPATISCYRNRVVCLLKRTGITDYRKISPEVVEDESRSYVQQLGVKRAPAQVQWMSAFRAFGWGLRKLGKAAPAIDRQEVAKKEEESVMIAFLNYGRRLGWAESTLKGRNNWLRSFRSFQHRRRGSWPIPHLRDIDRFLQPRSRRWAPGSLILAAGAMRAWLRFLYVTGRSKYDLAESVMMPIRHAFAQPARTLPWPTVRRFARGIDRSTRRGRRDYAQYLLLCVYGLGPSEIVDLKLDDIDWAEKILHAHRRKTGVGIDLPLLPAVSKALTSYLRHGRPPTSSRYVFLSHHIPHEPLHPIAITDNVARWAARGKIKALRLNARLFRHSHATRQLEHGVPLKIIGDILGHQDSLTTSRYVRSALKGLRRIAPPVPR